MDRSDGVLNLMTKASKYLDKAVEARENFYAGLDQAGAGLGDPRLRKDAQYRFGESLVGKQFLADNRWHMAQTRTWALMSIAKGVYVLIFEHRRTNKLLEELVMLQKETRNALRRN